MRILHADECDEQTDTDRYRDFDGSRDHVEDRFTHIEDRQENENNTLCEYRSQSDLPGIAHDLADCEGKIRVESHTGRQNERQIGDQTHHDGCQR